MLHFAMFFTGKAKRLKEAKEEAVREIDTYRKERETQFQQRKTQV